MTDLPGPGDRITLTTLGQGTYATWVDDADDDWMAVVEPRDLLEGDEPAHLDEVTVHWHTSRGRHQMPTVLVGKRQDGGVVWDLEIDGDVEIAQNRLYVRGGGGGPVRMTPVGTEEPRDPCDGVVVDLSERSVRGRFKEVAVEVGHDVTVRIGLDGVPVEVDGSVLRVTEDPDGRGIDVVAVFDPTEDQATTIRRHILAEQLRARQALVE